MKLPPQQQQLYELLLTSARQKEICQIMNLSQQTVDTYQKIIFKKLGVQNRIELIFLFYEELLGRHGVTVKTSVELLKLKKIRDLTAARSGGTLPRSSTD